MNFLTIDIVFLVVILIFTVRCALRGLITELMSMAAVVLGLLAALFFHRKGGEYVRERFMPDVEKIPEVIAFIALFLIVFLCVKIIERMIKQIIEGIQLGAVDRFLGIIFGFVEGIIVVSLVLFVIQIQPLFEPGSLLDGSFFAEMLMPFITGREKNAVDTLVLIRQLRPGIRV